MQPENIKTLIETEMPGSQAQVSIDGSHVSLVVISEEFAGLSPVKKQQRVYAILNDAISSGTIHAVHMKTLTPDEWAQQQ
ncbi:BolA family protein [Marinimicrobium alkaliphilum]|uniref:BolA family protein n=1 Tax=Marinimicrobium alkaliphilum TaxID=2202654 RepID=UPI000DB9729B|nr:BolA/IbaG family iron-sulfur metabolism protein [Marinimicrobium alkaliphilum]